ncbi:MAG: lactate utilization protein C [Rhodocyclaceae bacterium]|nr:lactate utilization protein C [Rhodocyclaceae bacterium]
MTTREDILGRVRSGLGRNAANAAVACGEIDAWLAAKNQGPRPAVAGDAASLLARFREKSAGLSSTVDTVADEADVPAAIARYLGGLQLTPQAVCWPALAGLFWSEAGLTVAARGAIDADLVGITGSFCAIAETGTLLLLSGADTPATVSLLPETHIAIVAASRIVPGMEEAWQLIRTERGELPRGANFISGPSRTGDIEQTIVLGAHGPYRVHIVIVADA